MVRARKKEFTGFKVKCRKCGQYFKPLTNGGRRQCYNCDKNTKGKEL